MVSIDHGPCKLNFMPPNAIEIKSYVTFIGCRTEKIVVYFSNNRVHELRA